MANGSGTKDTRELLGSDAAENSGAAHPNTSVVDGNRKARNRGNFPQPGAVSSRSASDNSAVRPIPTKYHNQSDALPSVTASASNPHALEGNAAGTRSSAALAGTVLGANDATTLYRSDASTLSQASGAFMDSLGEILDTPLANRDRSEQTVIATEQGAIDELNSGSTFLYVDAPMEFDPENPGTSPAARAVASFIAYAFATGPVPVRSRDGLTSNYMGDVERMKEIGVSRALGQEQQYEQGLAR